MARVTVEDCILKVPNRFELVLLTAQRARDISSGAPLTVEEDNDKKTVISLREIAESTVAVEELRKSVLLGLQKTVDFDEPEEDEELAALEEELAAVAVDVDLAQEMRLDAMNTEGEGDELSAIDDDGENEADADA